MSGMWTLSSAQYQATASPAERPRSVSANSASHGGIPEPPASLPELEGLSVRELQALLSERARFDQLIATHAHTRAVEAALAPLRREVEALETRASDDEDECPLDVLDAEVRALRAECAQWARSNSEYHLEARLVALIDEGERNSVALVDEWRTGTIAYQEFISKYIACRTRIAERRLKLDKFREKMRRAKAR